MNNQHTAQAQLIGLLNKLKYFLAGDLGGHTVQVQPRFGLVAALLEFAKYAVLHARTLEVEHEPGVQRLDARTGVSGVTVPLRGHCAAARLRCSTEGVPVRR